MNALILSLIITATPKELADNAISEANLTTQAFVVLRNNLDAAPVDNGSYSSKALKALNGKARAAVVTAALTVLKTYLSSAEAHQKYGQQVVGDAPEGPREQIAQLETVLKGTQEESKKALAEAAPAQRAEMRKAYDKLMGQFAENLKTAKEKLPEALKAYQPEYDAWVARRDEAGKGLDAKVKETLEAFLTGTKEMPFTAKLGTDGVFVDPKLEAMPHWWKACWRAGKEPVDAARSFATSWAAALK